MSSLYPHNYPQSYTQGRKQKIVASRILKKLPEGKARWRCYQWCCLFQRSHHRGQSCSTCSIVRRRWKNHEKKKKAKAGADTKGDSPQKASCRSNKKRSGPTKIKRKDLPPPLPSSDSLTVSHTSPSLSAPSRPIPVRPASPPQRQPCPRQAAQPRPPPPTIKQPGKRVVLHPMQLAKDRVLLRKRQTRFANIQRI